jgi:hypothetical protein
MCDQPGDWPQADREVPGGGERHKGKETSLDVGGSGRRTLPFRGAQSRRVRKLAADREV